ncbi:uncharacterized protein LOC127874026 [Dreissena polymorpha]|uniref:NAD-dependent epimerase/dehydratase domain-containing protein n=1 Tax=Dreissena polymorpha TaxID=45954 RepID=A0A9D4MLH6_DREPO|nr:uncharacterized protein LOC127874026 [Dreissena polymorpha]KAH3878164.1 hypothetical protein DPMN_002050 [Dreissena polymorpha]
MEGATETTRVLVTGASGYIATHIIQQLQQAGYQVRATLRSLEDAAKAEKLRALCPEAAHALELVEADLTKPESWEPAVKDVTYVIHAASPFPMTPPKDESEIVTPAVDGTQAILKACVQAKSVKKVVMTSSSVAVRYGSSEPNKTYTEEDWMEPEGLDAHGKSKVMAEKAAWDYVKELPDEDKVELAVVNPSYVMGPVLNGSKCSSTDVVKRLLEHSSLCVPKLNFSIVDVRDVAAAHIKAMTSQEASGKRHLVTNDNMWMKEIAQVLSKEFKSQGYSVPTANYPNAVLNLIGMFDKSVKMIIPQVNKVIKFDNSRMKEVLGVTPRDLKETILDMAYSLIEAGIVKKSKKYRGPGGIQADKEEEVDKKEEGDDKPKENGDLKEGEEKKEGDETKEDEKKEADEKKEEKEGEEKKEEKEEKDNKEEEKPAEKTEESKPTEESNPDDTKDGE